MNSETREHPHRHGWIKSRFVPGLRQGLRYLLGGLFVYAGVMKVISPAAFLQDIEAYRILPHALAWCLSVYLPWLEIIAGAALWHSRLQAPARWILIGLMLVFLAALISAWWRGLDLTCGCFGKALQSSNYFWLLTRDVLLLSGLVWTKK
jgi:putative oxidoreductase